MGTALRIVMRHDGRVTDADRVSEAVAELYSSDLDAFTERRGALAARARAAGEGPAAKAIAGLRKPTRSAWAVNQVVRADPSVPSRLAALGDELRAAEAALDGAAIRELSVARRQLIGALVTQALAVSGQDPPSAALREEVTATFTAALADPELAGQLAAGTLVRAERRAGFGSGAEPVLILAPSPPTRRLAPVTEETVPAKPAAGTAAGTSEAAAAMSRSRSAGREVEESAQPAQRIGERHQRPAVQHAARRAQVRRPGQPAGHLLRRGRLERDHRA